jgi:hypothetical protein
LPRPEPSPRPFLNRFVIEPFAGRSSLSFII